MAKNYFERYVWLLNVINDYGPITFKEISNRWAHSKANTLGESYLPERTFHNHREAIQETFGIEIKCDRSLGYYIADSDEIKGEGVRQWLLASLSLNNLLNESRDMRDRILFEKIYSSQRWYMLAKSEGKDTPRFYSLDERMIDVKPTDENYMLPAKFNAEEYFNDYFGIIVGTEWAPQEIKIRVVNDQVKYFDSLPLHDSQIKVPAESNEEYTVYRYHLAPTFDLKQELLSRGPAVEVLSPEAFRLEIQEDIAAMAKKYGL